MSGNHWLSPTPSWRYNPFISVYKYISAELLQAFCYLVFFFPPLTASAPLSPVCVCIAQEMYSVCVVNEDTIESCAETSTSREEGLAQDVFLY